MADVTSLDTALSDVNPVLVSIADQLGIDITILIASFAVCLVLMIIILIGLIRKPSESPFIITAVRGETQEKSLKYVERTLAEFPIDTIRIEITKGKLVIKLVEAKPQESKQQKLKPPEGAKEG